MFSSLTRRFGTRVIDRLDLLVELSTLGGYGLDREGMFALEPDEVAPDTSAPAGFTRSRDDCPHRARLRSICRDAAVRP